MPHKSLDSFFRACSLPRLTSSTPFPLLDALSILIPVFGHSPAVWNSGAEAVEASVKLARHATGKQNIIVVQGSYHGRTFGTMALTKSKTIYGAGYAPLMVSLMSLDSLR
jgi:4-aminobutyrate aminotransferase-like enzyme